MHVRIVNPTGYSMDTKVIDVESGVQVKGVTGVVISIPLEGVIRARVEVLAEIDVVAEATIERVRLNTEPIAEVELPPQ